MKRGRLAIGLLLLGVVTASATFVVVRPDLGDPLLLTGVVVGPDGAPISRARVTGPDGAVANTDGRGRFQMERPAGWVTIRAKGWLPRSRAAAPGEPIVVRLAPRTPDTVTLAFGGDVMFGRRYYDPEEDGSLGGLLTPGSSAASHARLLASVAPLWQSADIAAVNLETPLIEYPYYDPTEARPARFHPTKELTFASAPAAAQALKDLGIDLVDLGNNHLYDALEPGVTSTLEAVERAGLGHFGAGTSSGDAWSPAYRSVRGVRVAFLGCTSIFGDDQAITYVASPDKGGAAGCSMRRVRQGVRAARQQADIVVVMIHGGVEYRRVTTDEVQALSDAAIDAGATMVINHHPHVVGGLRFAEGHLTAGTLGNLLFDQTVWPTFESYVLQVAVRDGKVVSAWAEPVRLQQFTPVGLYGPDAAWAARGALARSAGPWIEDDGSLWLAEEKPAASLAQAFEGTLARIDAGCAPTAGRELLWTGAFEVGDLTGAQAPLWNTAITSPYRKVDQDAARSGDGGVLLQRGSGNAADVVLTIDHRVLVEPDHRLTLLLDARARFGSPTAQIRIGWYNGTIGSSQQQSTAEVVATDDWRTLRIDVTVPRNAVAAQPFIALQSPSTGVSQLAIDNVALIDWDQPGCDFVQGSATLELASLPPAASAPAFTRIAATLIPVEPVGPIPPGPNEPNE